MHKVAFFLLLHLSACSAAEPRSWIFVQSVGGLRIEKPLVSEIGGWALPVIADVSGLKATTTKPTALNSALACDTGALIEGQSIYITLKTERVSGTKTAVCPFIQLGRVAPGSYSVFYRGPNEQPVALGQVQISL